MVVGPGDRSGVGIVRHMSRGIRLGMFRMEKVRATNAAERAERSPEVLMIASGHDAAASLAETRDALTVGRGQAFTQVNRKQPELLHVGLIERAQDRIITGGIQLTIARRHFV